MSATANFTYFESGIGVKKSDGTYVDCIGVDGSIDAPVTTTDLTTTGNTTLGNATSDTLAVNGNSTFTGTATGTMIDVVDTATTTGIGVDLTGNTALTTGQLLSIGSSATAIATTGRMLLSSHSGATGTSAVLNEFLTAATDETVLLQAKASGALAAGKIVNISGAAMTTGTAVDIGDLDALTSGKGVHVASAATAMTSGGRLLQVEHTGATSTSGVLAEVTSAATDETIVAQIGASAALAAGKVLNISGAAVTTGTLVDISDNTAHTTGTALNVVTNSADTGTRTLVNIKQDHASASGATPLVITNDSNAKPLITGTATVQSTHFYKIATFNGVTLWMGDGNTANTALSGTAGDILFNGGSNKPEYCTGTTNWSALV